LRVQSDEATASPAPASPAPALAPAGDVATSPAPASLPAPVSLVRRTIGPTLVGVGGLVAVTGVALMLYNGKNPTGHTGCRNGEPCAFEYKTSPWGPTLLGAGLLTAALGTYLWVTTPSGTAVTAAVGLDGLSVFGTF
jgi:hypothetical protein